jgi:hypothetical protein
MAQQVYVPLVMVDDKLIPLEISSLQQPSPPIQLPGQGPPAPQPLKRKKKKDKPVSQACIICSHDHASCDDERPCKRCVSKGFPHLCKTPIKTRPTKKGRPARALNKYTSIVHEAEQEALAAQVPLDNVLSTTNNGTFNMVNGYVDTTTMYNSFESMISTNNTSQLVQSSTPLISYTASAANSYVTTNPVFSLPSPHMDALFASPEIDILSLLPDERSISTNNEPQLSLPPTPTQEQPKKIEDKKDVGKEELDCCMETECCMVDERSLQRMLAQLSIRSGGLSDKITEMQSVTRKLKELRTLVMKNIATLEDVFQARFMSIQAHTNAMSLPVILCAGLGIMFANAAACELFRMKKSEIMAKKYFFNLLASDYCVAFMKKWSEATMDYVDLDRMKLKVEGYGGVQHECILNTTIHRETTTGCPMIEMYILMRIDDL